MPIMPIGILRTRRSFSLVLFYLFIRSRGNPPVLSCTFQVKRMFMYVINKRNCSHAHSMDFVNIKVMSKQFTYIKLNYPSERARHTRRIGEKLIHVYWTTCMGSYNVVRYTCIRYIMQAHRNALRVLFPFLTQAAHGHIAFPWKACDPKALFQQFRIPTDGQTSRQTDGETEKRGSENLNWTFNF